MEAGKTVPSTLDLCKKLRERLMYLANELQLAPARAQLHAELVTDPTKRLAVENAWLATTCKDTGDDLLAMVRSWAPTP